MPERELRFRSPPSRAIQLYKSMIAENAITWHPSLALEGCEASYQQGPKLHAFVLPQISEFMPREPYDDHIEHGDEKQPERMREAESVQLVCDEQAEDSNSCRVVP